jgi:DNA polymerase
MNNLSIDIETFSSIDLKKCGVYKYAESDDFEILLFAYSKDNEDVKVVDLACGESLPPEIIKALLDDNVEKWAFNSQFERVCISAWLRKNYPDEFYDGIEVDTNYNYLSPISWKCSMVWSAYMGLPQSLEGVGEVLGLDEQKLKIGKDLIRYFCMPSKPTKSNGGRTRNLPNHDMKKWELFKEYNKRDVEVELAIQKKLSKFLVPNFIWQEYYLDQEINDRGILIDMQVVENAISINEKNHDKLMKDMKNLTGLDNPNSTIQMKQWLKNNNIGIDSLDKNSVKELLKSVDEPIKTVLLLRQQLSKSSIKKYQAMKNVVCIDNRARGMFKFLGANRSGRWSGRLIQLQNLPQNHMPDLEQARNLVKNNDYLALEMLYDISDTLSQLIRTSFIPREGYKFIVADFSAIEARVLSHLAGEEWRNEVFKNNGDIYCATASRMFNCKVEKHGENSHLRQKGKQAELACGYGGSVGALKSMGALDLGLCEDELLPLVKAFRNSNPKIVNLWWEVDKKVKEAINLRTTTETHGIYFIYQSGMLFIELPSKRRLCYVRAMISENKFGGESVTYEGIGQQKKWERIESYGPKFVENIVQAISRDILMYAISNLRHCFIVAHIHDEIVIECSKNVMLDVVCEQMSKTPPWIDGLNLSCDGYETLFYKKD